MQTDASTPTSAARPCNDSWTTPCSTRITLDARVNDGWVTLTGHADRQFQSDKAFDHISSLRGVTGVTNEITVDQRLP